MRILVLNVRRRPPEDMAVRIRERAELSDDVQLELLTVHPTGPVPGFARVDAVEPSLVPWRPLVTTSIDGSADGLPAPRLLTRGLRAVRRRSAKVPVPKSMRSRPRTYLAVACATSRDVHVRAREVDAVIAYGGGACLAAWRLARRVPDTPIVFRPTNLRRVLSGLDRPAPPRSSVAERRERSDHRGGYPSPPELPAAESSVRLLVAPANYAGQAHAWASSVRRHLPNATALNFRAGSLKNPFPSDYSVESAVFHEDLEWRIKWRDHVLSTFTHVLAEANRPLFGSITGRGDQSVRELIRAGKGVALVSHGTDSRIPSVHAARETWHQYDALPAAQVRRMEEAARANVAFYESFEGPVFVSTPGLLEFVPHARWLPVVVEPDMWHPHDDPMRRDVPIVAHVPSGPQKGSHMIDPILGDMARRGLIEYLRIEGVPFSEMPDLYGRADIMVEQFGIADYSTAACEAMAAGRVVVSRVADGVREHVLNTTGLELPIVEANPMTLEAVILDLIRDRDRAVALGEQSFAFAREVHDGRLSASVLGLWLGRKVGGERSRVPITGFLEAD
jgi:hypothetical protein